MIVRMPKISGAHDHRFLAKAMHVSLAGTIFLNPTLTVQEKEKDSRRRKVTCFSQRTVSSLDSLTLQKRCNGRNIGKSEECYYASSQSTCALTLPRVLPQLLPDVQNERSYFSYPEGQESGSSSVAIIPAFRRRPANQWSFILPDASSDIDAWLVDVLKWSPSPIVSNPGVQAMCHITSATPSVSAFSSDDLNPTL